MYTTKQDHTHPQLRFASTYLFKLDVFFFLITYDSYCGPYKQGYSTRHGTWESYKWPSHQRRMNLLPQATLICSQLLSQNGEGSPQVFHSFPWWRDLHIYMERIHLSTLLYQSKLIYDLGLTSILISCTQFKYLKSQRFQVVLEIGAFLLQSSYSVGSCRSSRLTEATDAPRAQNVTR